MEPNLGVIFQRRTSEKTATQFLHTLFEGCSQYQGLLKKRLITFMFEDALRRPKKSGDFGALRMFRYILDELVGFAAAETNHAKTVQEEKLLQSAFVNLETALNRIDRWGSRAH